MPQERTHDGRPKIQRLTRARLDSAGCPRSAALSLLLLAVLSGNTSPNASASPSTDPTEFEPQERILETARVFLTDYLAGGVHRDTRIEIGRLDSRLQLRRCAEPPTAQIAPGATLERISTINIRCAAPVTWSIFVPVKVEHYAEAIVAARPIARQQVIGPSDLQLQRTEVSKLPLGYLDDPTAAIGFEAQRALNPGQVLSGSNVAPRQLIKRGQQVTILSARPGLQVQMKGEAMEDGALGQRIRVRNRSSKRIIEGYVQPSGNIRVAL